MSTVHDSLYGSGGLRPLARGVATVAGATPLKLVHGRGNRANPTVCSAEKVSASGLYLVEKAAAAIRLHQASLNGLVDKPFPAMRFEVGPSGPRPSFFSRFVERMLLRWLSR